MALATATPGTTAVPTQAATATSSPVQVYGARHCSNDACLWGSVRDMADFDRDNHWLIDRRDGRPSVNVVVLSFVNPLRLLNGTTDGQTANSLPVGMNSAVVDYFTSHGIRVMLSIGGITYTSDRNTALAQNATLLGRRAAELATRLGVGIEVDYANAMAPSKQPSTTTAESNWHEHLIGRPTYHPPIPPLAPAKFTGSLYIAEGSQVRPECTDFAGSLQNSTGGWLRSAAPAGAGSPPGLLGHMFWAAERPSTRGVTTGPPNTCEGGVGAGATVYDIPVPMPALRQS